MHLNGILVVPMFVSVWKQQQHQNKSFSDQQFWWKHFWVELKNKYSDWLQKNGIFHGKWQSEVINRIDTPNFGK